MSNHYEILHRTWRCDCHALYKIPVNDSTSEMDFFLTNWILWHLSFGQLCYIATIPDRWQDLKVWKQPNISLTTLSISEMGCENIVNNLHHSSSWQPSSYFDELWIYSHWLIDKIKLYKTTISDDASQIMFVLVSNYGTDYVTWNMWLRVGYLYWRII